MGSLRSALSWGLLLLCFTAAVQPVAPGQQPAASQAQRRPTSEPYTGDLSIFETPGRGKKLHIEQVMDLLGITPGKAVADIGAGSGWFTVRAARRVADSGTVYAVDINPDAIKYISSRLG